MVGLNTQWLITGEAKNDSIKSSKNPTPDIIFQASMNFFKSHFIGEWLTFINNENSW
uniref:Uncharacterized protein n=1 Tax=Tetranychus urticae TaxID=32264 RepID=T1JUM5_TETUR